MAEIEAAVDGVIIGKLYAAVENGISELPASSSTAIGKKASAYTRLNDFLSGRLLCMISYIHDVECEVIYTDEFENWWNDLKVAEQEDVSAAVLELERHGVTLRHPRSSGITTAATVECGSCAFSMTEGPIAYSISSIRAGMPSFYWVAIKPAMTDGMKRTSRKQTGSMIGT